MRKHWFFTSIFILIEVIILIDWILSHKQLILIFCEILISLITLISIFCKKKPKVIYTLSYILESIPDFIKIAESVFGSGYGEAKLEFVKQLIYALKNKLGFTGFYDFDSYIEKILETPEKKGGP